MSRRANRSTVLGARGALPNWRIHCERSNASAWVRQRAAPATATAATARCGNSCPSRDATAALPAIGPETWPDWRDCESIRAEFEAREAAGGRPRDERASVVAQRSCGHPMRL